MRKRNEKSADSVALQLMSMCKGNAMLIDKAKLVMDEFKTINAVDNIVRNQNHLMLNKVLHATRAMDTGMRTFLELNQSMPNGQYSMGAYLVALKKGKKNRFARLNGKLSDRIQTSVVDKRNTFVHAAGKFPSKREAEQLAQEVVSYLQTILNLGY